VQAPARETHESGEKDLLAGVEGDDAEKSPGLAHVPFFSRTSPWPGWPGRSAPGLQVPSVWVAATASVLIPVA
jgi:hypothetical protein